MPFRKRGLTMFRDWIGDEQFDPEVDRLLVTTSHNDVFVARNAAENTDGDRLVVDKQYMPDNLMDIPSRLRREHQLPGGWDPQAQFWEVRLYDGEMGVGGPDIVMEVIGIGWSLTIHTSLFVRSIVPVSLPEIKASELDTTLSGLHPREFIINEQIMRDNMANA